MVSFTTMVTGLLAALPLAAAHMEMSEPAPFRSKFNKAATNIDYSNTAPLSADGSNFPCKGYHVDLGTPAGAPTASYAPGSTQKFTIVGGAAHGGGSCQASLSYDGGRTFTVIKSIIGGCPLQSSYDFTVPADAKPGTAIFAWTWFNQLGNREMYMNCAPVTITGGNTKREVAKRENKKRAAAFSARPGLFTANIGNGCKTLESADVTFPNPGPDVQDNGGKQSPPTGSCGSAAPGGGAPAAPAPIPAPAPSSSPSAAPAPSQAPAPSVVPSAAPSVAPKPTTTLPGSVKTSPTVSSSRSPNSSGVFITASAAPSAAPTTLQTSKAPSATPSPAPAPAPVPAPAPGTGSGAGRQSGACTNEGAWNCIDGTSFQRCASGRWSAPIPVAPGTKCTPGTGSSLTMAGRRVVRSLPVPVAA